jgi:Lrp/AsnC family leucine-responsive transcriptional regulator
MAQTGDFPVHMDNAVNLTEERPPHMQNDLTDLDRFDRAILRELATNGRISITDLAARIGLSKSPTQARLKRLEKDGIITGYRALFDPIRLGLDHVSFVEVRLQDTREAALAAFNAAVRQIPEIEQVHLIAGNFDYLLKIRTQDMNDYRIVLAEKISTLPHVSNTSTYVAMQAIKENTLADVI